MRVVFRASAPLARDRRRQSRPIGVVHMPPRSCHSIGDAGAPESELSTGTSAAGPESAMLSSVPNGRQPPTPVWQVLADDQDGVLSRGQLIELGYTPARARQNHQRAVARLVTGCERDVSGPVSAVALVWAALLYAGRGAVASHATALWLAGLLNEPPSPVSSRWTVRRSRPYIPLPVRHECGSSPRCSTRLRSSRPWPPSTWCSGRPSGG